MGRHNSKPPRRFGMAHEKHRQHRKERVQEAKVGRKSFKCSIRGPVVDQKYACLVNFPDQTCV